MVAFVDPHQHRYYEPYAVTWPRYLAIARDVADAVEEDGPVPPLDARQTALLLVSLASYESAFNGRVDRCEKGLAGAWGLWQTTASKAVVCSDRRVAVRLALAWVRRSFQQCRRLPLLDRLSAFTDGTCHANWPRSRWRVGRALRWR